MRCSSAREGRRSNDTGSSRPNRREGGRLLTKGRTSNDWDQVHQSNHLGHLVDL